MDLTSDCKKIAAHFPGYDATSHSAIFANLNKLFSDVPVSQQHPSRRKLKEKELVGNVSPKQSIYIYIKDDEGLS